MDNERFGSDSYACVRKFLLRRGVSPEHVDDVVQSAMLRAWQHRHKFRGESKWTTWLCRIAINEHLMFVRARNTRVHDDLADAAADIAADTPSQFDSFVYVEKIESVLSYARLLRPTHEEAIHCVMRDETMKETALRLGLTLPTVKTRRHRSIRELVVLMRDELIRV